MKKVITYGTFDLFHFGHLEILRRAKKLGEYLVVAISTDKFNEIKDKKCVYPFEHRINIVEAIKYVDEVITNPPLIIDENFDYANYHMVILLINLRPHHPKHFFLFFSSNCHTIF